MTQFRSALLFRDFLHYSSNVFSELPRCVSSFFMLRLYAAEGAALHGKWRNVLKCDLFLARLLFDAVLCCGSNVFSERVKKIRRALLNALYLSPVSNVEIQVYNIYAI